VALSLPPAAVAAASSAGGTARGRQNETKLPSGVGRLELSVSFIGATGEGQAPLLCSAGVDVCIAAVDNGDVSRNGTFLTSSSFDAASVASVTQARKLDPGSNAALLDSLREHGVSSLAYADLNPRPMAFLSDDGGSVQQCDVAGWGRLALALASNESAPTDVPIPWQQPSGLPPMGPPASTQGSGVPTGTPLARAPISALPFPLPAGAQRWFGVGHRLPSALTTFRVIYSTSYANVPVFAGPPYNGTIDPTFAAQYGLLTRCIADEVSSRGLLHRTHRLLMDEPDLAEPETFTNLVALLRFHHAAFPDVQLWQTASASGILSLPDDVVAEVVGTWVVNNPSVDEWLALRGKVARACEARGVPRARWPRLMLYDNGVAVIGMPLLRTRLFPWGVWQSRNPFNEKFRNASDPGMEMMPGASGTLSFYSVAAWGSGSQTKSVWQDPSAPDPVHRRPGWGFLLYPPEAGTPAAPVRTPDGGVVVPSGSLRSEALRAGLQDAALLDQLKSAVRTVNSSSCNVSDTCIGRAREEAVSLLNLSGRAIASWIPRAWSKTWRDSFSNEGYTTNTTLVYHTRRVALSLLERLKGS